MSEDMDTNHNRVVWAPLLRRQAFDWEVSTIVSLLGKLDSIVVKPDQEDRQIWLDDPDGLYRVKFGIPFFGNPLDRQVPWKAVWLPPVPPKVQFFMWVATLGKISTIDLLRRKGFILTNFCCLCKEEGESVSHIMIHCPFSWDVWGWLLRDFGMRWVPPRDLSSLLAVWKGNTFSTRGNQI